MGFRSFQALAAAFVLLFLSSFLLAQTQNNLVSRSDARIDLTKPAASRSAKPAISDVDVKTLSDEELDGLFNTMVARYSKDYILYNNIGAAYFQRKMYDKAKSAIQRSVMLNYHPAILINLSIVYDTLGHLSDAITAAQRAVAQSPQNARARNELCELTMASKRDADTVACYDELRKIEPLDALAQTYYSIALYRSGSPDKAVSLLSSLMKSEQPTALMFNALGNAYYMKKRYAQAADAFKQGVELDPDSDQLRYNLAIALNTVNNRPGALSEYNLMKERDPKMADQLYRALYRDKIVFVDDAADSKKK